MKKKSVLLLGLAALAMSIGAVGAFTGANSINENAVAVKAADEAPTYSLNPAKGTNNSYAASCNIAIDGVTWNLTGNSQMLPWRIGGKDISNVTRRLYSTTPLNANIDKVEISIGKVGITVNSAKFAVYSSESDAKNGVNAISEISLAVKASSVLSVGHPVGDELWNNVFYSFDFDVTSGKSNTFVEFVGADFFEKVNTTDPSIEVVNGADIRLETNGIKTIQFDVQNLPSDGAVVFSIDPNEIVEAEYNETNNTLDILAGDNPGQVNYTVSLVDAEVNELASVSGTITVYVAPNGVKLTGMDDNTVLKLGTKTQLSATVLPENCSQNVVWSVSDSNVASVSADGLLTVLSHGTNGEGYTVTAKSTENEAIFGSLHFKTSNEFKVSELISLDGETYQNNLKDGDIVSTKGTVTGIEGSSVYLQSEGAALMLYSLPNVDDIELGDGLEASGKLKNYNGLIELTACTVKKNAAVKEDVVATKLTAGNLMDYKESGVLKEVKNAVCQENRTIGSNSNAFGVKFLLDDGTTSFTAYVQKATIPYLRDTLGFDAFVKGKSYDFTGNKLLYTKSGTTTPQLMISKGCKIELSGTAEAQAFVDTYIAPKAGAPVEGDTCDAKYNAAKGGYDQLSENAKNVFDNQEKFADAKAIFDYWAEHRANKAGVVQSLNKIGTTKEAGINGAVAGTVAVAGVAAVGFVLTRKKKHE